MKPASAVLATAVALALAAVAGAAAASEPPLVPPVPVPALPSLPPVLGGDPPASTPSTPPTSSPAAAAGTTRSNSATTTSVAAQLQRLVTAEVNVVRRAHGRSRLSVSTQLARAGREHARELALAGYFSHDWTDGTPFSRWIRRFYPVAGARTWRAGENLAWSTPGVSAQQAVELWLQSPVHRRILLDKRWRQVGLGVVRADGAGGVYGGQSVVILAAEFGLRR